MFFHRTPTVVLDCFTPYNSVLDHFPIKLSKEIKPSFFKKVPTQTLESSAVHPRHCPGMHDLINRGVVLPTWVEIFFTVTVENNNVNVDIQERSGQTPISPMNFALNGDDPYFNKVDYVFEKICPPWKIKANSKVNFLQTNTLHYHMNVDFIVVSGVLDFYYQHSTSVIQAINKSKSNKFSITPGEPICQFVPLEKVNIKIKNHYISSEEYDKMDRQITFVNNFVQLKNWSLKK
jgi:hypothetical protein|tara:strand:+ start:4467 stop:5168 length:702 start_codon:yes stop_codon:yes gene_type:complete